MDKKTLIGLALIGLILAAFTFLNRPSEEDLKKQQLAQIEKQTEKQNIEVDSINKSLKSDSSLNNENIGAIQNDTIHIDSNQHTENTGVTLANNVDEETYILENDKIKVILTNKGGGVKSVFLKEYQTYQDYEKNKESDSITPLQLFNEKVSSNGLVFKVSGKEVRTNDIAFKVLKLTDNQLSFVADFGDGRRIEQIYSSEENQYHINYEIKIIGFEDDVQPENVYLDWHTELFKTEKLLSEQRRTSTVFYKEKGGSYSYLSEHSDDEVVAKTDIDWLAFKQSYFSAIMMPENSFKKEGTNFKVTNFVAGSPKDSSYIKIYDAMLNPGFNSTENGSVRMKWYFGPNDYNHLATYENGTEDLLNYGWGLFRWINIYAIQPLFVWLANFGMNLGIAILLLTIIVKLVLTPIQWKMYVSSAKMRILKPEIEELTKKYPDKSQAMEKQMEMMTLYKESGASPLSGCVPMLIQMPILFAVFRFFPSTFALRQESFLWADDLSSYDSILDLSFNIPFYGSHVSLFTLLMAGTTLIYTVLNSSNQMQPTQPGMPNMKIIMYFFPIMMIFFFNNYSSGLSYYYFISTLMSILTMVAIKNFFVDEEKLKAKMAARKSATRGDGKKKKKSKFQERLEEMQKLQLEKSKNAKKK